MATITKKELIDRIAEQLGVKRVLVKRVAQYFLDEIILELGRGNRLEFRDFGVFECKQRAARVAQNPKTMERVSVPSKRTVKFKVGRLMKGKMAEIAAKQAASDGRGFGEGVRRRTERRNSAASGGPESGTSTGGCVYGESCSQVDGNESPRRMAASGEARSR